MIAFHFPPLAGSSGIQRTLRFAQHLPTLGWQPLVLTARAMAYERTSDDLLNEVPDGMVVRRALALDTARHLQFNGRYFGPMARPDRWMSWKFDAVRIGLQLIREFKPVAIWSTYPIATAHVIASRLHQKTGIPWVADFRDPMAQIDYPADPETKRQYLEIEADAVNNASFCVFTTPGAARTYQKRYPHAASRIVVLENGYDEESFKSSLAKLPIPSAVKTSTGPFIMLHSGIVYPSERDPTQFFEALGELRSKSLLSPTDLMIRFRASVNDDLLSRLALAYGIQDFIELRPAIPYRDALAEMMAVDALLVMQASNCNDQIPAKLYEYLRAGKPIVGLTDPVGDTAGVMRAAGLFDIARLDSSSEISVLLLRLLGEWRQDRRLLPTGRAVHQATRLARSKSLVELLDRAF